jgi:putative flippase GtrA
LPLPPLLRLAPQFARYFVSGSLALATHLIVLMTLVELLAMSASLATSIGFFIGLSVNYIIQRRWVFHVDGAHRVLFVRYVGITLATFGVNILLFRIAYEGLGLWYPLAQVLATGIIFVANFVINLHYTFRLGT